MISNIYRICCSLGFLLLLGFTAFGQNLPVLVSIHASSQTLPSILNELSDKYNLHFAYDAAALKEIVITADIELEEVETALTILLEPHNFGVRKVSSTYVVIPLVQSASMEEENQKVSIKGTVMDKDSGEPLPYANIRMIFPPRYFQCDAQGDFVIVDAPSDTTQLIFYYVGFEEKKVIIQKLKKERNPTVLLGVKRDFLPEAEVIAKGISPIQSSPQPGLLEINPQRIGSINGPGETDVLRSAQLLPGINGTNESSNGLIIRGSAGDQSLLTVDGFTIYHMDHLFGITSAINPLAIKNIRISKGVTPAHQATRIGGNVDVTAREGNRYESGGSVEVGPLSAGIFLESPLNNNQASVMIAARRSTVDLWKSPSYKELFNTVYNASVLIDNSKNATENSNYNFSDAIAKITWRPNSNNYLYLSGYYSQDQLGIAYNSQGSLSNYFYNYSDNAQWGNRGVGGGWKKNWSSKLVSEIKIGLSKYASSLNAVDTLLDTRFQDVTRIYREQETILDDFTSQASISYKKGTTTYIAGIYTNYVKTENVESNDVVMLNNQNSASTNAAFLERAGMWDKLNWNVGARITYFDATQKLYPEWRILANWESSDSIIFKASVGRVNQYIHRIRQQSLFLNQPDNWMISDNDNVPVLVSDQVVIGAIVPIDNFTVDFEGYLKSNTGVAFDLGQYQWLNASDNSEIVNGTSYALGFDLLVKMSARRHETWLAYSVAHSRMNLDSVDQFKSIAPNFDQLHELKIYHEYDLKNWSFWAMWVFGSGRPYTQYYGSGNVNLAGNANISYPIFGDINGSRITPYHRLDIGASTKWELKQTALELKMNISNVYNRTNIRDYQYVSVLDENGNVQVISKKIAMNGFIPSIQIKWTF